MSKSLDDPLTRSLSADSDPSIAPKPPVPRLASIDAYRGLVMFLMMAEVLRLCDVAEALRLREVAAKRPGHPFWELLCHHQSHVQWVGCSLHDLIQPSFSFLVGAALPFSLAGRLEKGQSKARMTLHALWRSLVLVFLGVPLAGHRYEFDRRLLHGRAV